MLSHDVVMRLRMFSVVNFTIHKAPNGGDDLMNDVWLHPSMVFRLNFLPR